MSQQRSIQPPSDPLGATSDAAVPPDTAPDTFEVLLANVAGLRHRFPDGDDPFQMVARLCEESGELAQQVNHFEQTGIKPTKYGPPDREHLAKEVMDVVRAALAIACHYEIVPELRAAIATSTQHLREEGHLP